MSRLEIPAALVASGRPLAEPRLAPDATSVVFSTRGPNGTQLVRIDLGDGTDVAVGPEIVLTIDPTPIGVHPSGGGSFDWSPDGTWLVYAAKSGLHRVPRAGGCGEPLHAPFDPGVSLTQPSVSPCRRWVAAVAGYVEHDAVIVIDIASGTTHEVGVAAFVMDPAWGPDGQLVWQEWAPPSMAWDTSAIVRVQIGDSGAGVLSVSPERRWETADVARSQPRFDPASGSLAWIDDASGFANVVVEGVPVRAEPAEHATPSWGPGQRSFAWSPDGAQMAFVRNEEGFARLVTATIGSATEATEVAKAWHLGVSWATTARGRDRIAAIRTGGKTPPQLVVYDLRSASDALPTRSTSPGQPTTPVPSGQGAARTTVARGAVGAWDRFDLREPEVFAFSAGDGTALHGRIYRPDGATGPTPTIVSLHGGPTDQTRIEFNARFHFWMSRGWSVLVPDTRGSTGHGRAYRTAMNGRWGELDVADAAAAIDHARTSGWCDRDVVAMGGSAGGFTALGLAAAEPAVRAVVALYPVTDLRALDATTHRLERHYNASLIGPLPERETAYVDRSPISFADRLSCPVLLLHGDSDETVGVQQSVALRDRIAAAGGGCELHVYEGEGHGWKSGLTVLDELVRTESFLLRNGIGTPSSPNPMPAQ